MDECQGQDCLSSIIGSKFSDHGASKILGELKNVETVTNAKIAMLLGWVSAEEVDLHDIPVRPPRISVVRTSGQNSAKCGGLDG